jgi:hypothetical protein
MYGSLELGPIQISKEAMACTRYRVEPRVPNSKKAKGYILRTGGKMLKRVTMN